MKELQLKAALIDYLIDNFGDKIQAISHEFRFADGKRRADLICIEKYMHAFEIKSDFDNLTKLKKQLSDYSECFETISVVTTQKHLKNVISISPKSVGILLASESKIFEYRPAKLRKKLKKVSLLNMVNSKEIKKELQASIKRSIKVTDSSEARKYLASQLSLEKCIKFVKNTLIEYTKENLASFLKERCNVTLTDDVQLLTMTDRKLTFHN